LIAPAGTPRPIIERLNADLRAILSRPDTRQRIAAQGGDPVASTPEEFAADIARETAKWAPVIKALGLKVE
jgi:tripartite-type tricarboxylate transporter receptor subunit TctC